MRPLPFQIKIWYETRTPELKIKKKGMKRVNEKQHNDMKPLLFLCYDHKSDYLFCNFEDFKRKGE